MREEKSMSGIAEVIRDRHSTRGSFDRSRPIAKPQLKLILEAARWAPTPTNIQNFEIVIVDETEQLEAIGKIPAQMSETFLRENYSQLSFSEAELCIKKTGMLASAFPKQWTDPEAWNPGADARSQLTFLGRSVKDTPLLLVVLYDGDKRSPGSDGDPLGQMGLGCVMENMWLMAEDLGIGMHVLTVFSDSPVEKQVKNTLQVPAHMKIAFACALGYPAEPAGGYLRVRRDIEDFVHHNQFGRKDILWKSLECDEITVSTDD
jgi:nitroreductase